MRKLLLTSFLLSAGLSSLMAAKVSEEDAVRTAQQFLTSHFATRATSQFTNLSVQAYKDALYIVNNQNGGWAIVAADDSLPRQILGYSSTGAISADNLSDGAKWILEEYTKGIRSQKSNSPALSVTKTINTSVSPLLGEIAWNQNSPYNDLCPEIDGDRTLAGCVNIALAQIMRFYKYPAKGSGSHYYEWNGTRLSVDFSKSEYKWDLMKPFYSGEESKTEKDAVAKLIYDLGVANESVFGLWETAASFRSGEFISIFDYDPGLTPIIRDECKAADYENILRSELDEGRPVYVEGGSPGGAHSFVCDGYDKEGYFHYNFGWGGDNNGYFLCSATGFDASPMLVIGIQPNKGGLPGIWGATGDDIYWTENDYISCYFNASISCGLRADIEAGFALEDEATGKILYFPKLRQDNTQNIQVFGFDFDDKVADGDYILYSVCKVSGGDWKRVYHGENASDYVKVNVKDGVKTYTNCGVGGEIDEGVTLIDGIYYILGETEATVTSRNNRGNCYSGDVTIPAEIEYHGKVYPVTAIGEYAFKLSQINNLTIGRNVNIILAAAFSQCHVENLQFAEDSQLKTIASWGFNLADIPVVVLPEGLEVIEACAFRGNIQLLDIPSTVSNLPSETFSSYSLKEVFVHWDKAENLPTFEDGTITTDVKYTTLYVPKGCIEMYRDNELWSKFGKIKDNNEPAEVVGIDNLYYIFENNEAVVTAPVTRAAGYSGDIVIPASVEYNNQVYPVTVIGERAFATSQIKSLTVGKNIRSIETEAFDQCRVDNFKFENGSQLKDIAFAAFSVADIPELRLPEGLTTIGERAFNGAIGILDLPASVTRIPSGAIASRNLSDMYVHWKSYDELPFNIDEPIEQYVSNATLHVPHNCSELYRQHKFWGVFGTITDDAAGINEILNDNDTMKIITNNGNISLESSDKDMVVMIYSIQGKLIASLSPGMTLNLGHGLYLVRNNHKTIKVIL